MEAIHLLSRSFVTLNNHEANEIHQFALSIIDRHHEELTPIIGLDDFRTVENVINAYSTYSPMEGNPPQPFIAPVGLPRAANAIGNNVQPAAAAAIELPAITAAVRKREETLSQIWNTLRTCFVNAWKAYLDCQSQNDANLRVKAMAQRLQITNATEAAQMLVDGQHAVPPEVLQQYIEGAVEKQLKTARRDDQKRIKSLENTIKQFRKPTACVASSPMRPPTNALQKKRLNKPALTV